MRSPGATRTEGLRKATPLYSVAVTARCSQLVAFFGPTSRALRRRARTPTSEDMPGRRIGASLTFGAPRDVQGVPGAVGGFTTGTCSERVVESDGHGDPAGPERCSANAGSRVCSRDA